MLVAVVVAVAVGIWLCRPAASRQTAARDAAAPFGRAVVRIVHGRAVVEDGGGETGHGVLPPALRATPLSEGGGTRGTLRAPLSEGGEKKGSKPGKRETVSALRAENERLRAELQLLRNVQAENAELRMHLGFVERNPTLIAAEVISSGGGDAWSRRLRLGKGRNQGVRPGAPVLAPEGLVGQIVEATDTTADVLLLTDPNSHVACVLANHDGTPLHGILSGTGATLPALLSGAPPLRVDYLDRNAAPAPGATVVTSGLGGHYPAGIAVGTLQEVTLDAGGLFARAMVVPIAPLRTLRAAYVLAGWGEDEP